MKLGIIHATMNAVEPLQNEIKKIDPSIEILNFMNESLLYEVNKKGKVDKEDLRKFMNVLFQCIVAGVDGILVGCSVYCLYVDIMRPFVDVPIVAVDEPMLQKALSTGTKIGVIATTASAAPTTENQLYNLAKKANKTIEVVTAVTTRALIELKLGNQELHNQLILKQGESLVKDGCDVIILAQVTMSVAQDSLSVLPVPVFSGPSLGAQAILDLMK